MKTYLLPMLFLLITLPKIAFASGNINLLYGMKSMNSDWMPAENHSEYGVAVDYNFGWPVDPAIIYYSSQGDGSGRIDGEHFNMEVETSEFNIGVKKIIYSPVFDRFRPYVGGGLSFIDITTNIDYEITDDFSATDSSTGIWVGLGMYWETKNSFNIGLDVTVSTAMAKVGTNYDFDIGGGHLSLICGYHF